MSKRIFETITGSIKNANKWSSDAKVLGIIVAMIVLITLGGCGKASQEEGSNSPTTNEEAEASMEVRLKKTEEVRLHLNSVREALRPLDSVLTDISNTLHAKVTVDGRPYDRFRRVINRLHEILRESTKSIVQYHSDGSWKIERNISLPLNRERYSCRTSQIQILGYRINDHEELSVNLLDCTSVSRISLISVKVYSDRIDVTFYPETLDQLIKPDTRIGQCLFRIRKNEAEIHCEPMEIKLDTLTAVIDPLDFSHHIGGTDVDFQMVIRDRKKKLLASIEVLAHPGTQTTIDIRTKDEGTGSVTPETP